MNTEAAVLQTLDEALSLNGRGIGFRSSTPLLGALPELDSIAVVGLISALESRFDIVVEDDELDAAMFSTVGSLVAFLNSKILLQ